MPASAEVAWLLLQNMDEVAACMPGAKLTERLDATHFKGTVAVKFGPANMSFKGDIEVLKMEAESMTLQLVGKGTDSTGSSGASMELTARVEAVGADSCNITGISEVSVSGKAAAFGNRLMGSVADQVLKQFSARFAEKVGSLQATLNAAVPAPLPAQSVHGAGAGPGAEAHAIAPTPDVGTTTAPFPPPQASLANEPPIASLKSEPTQLNALSLVFAIVRDWFASLFGSRKK